MVECRTDESFVQIVYAKVTANGKTELVPMKLYIDRDGTHLDRELPTPPATSGGKRLLANRYELQQVLGQGGFGKTYLTFDRHRFNEPCVVKEFLPQGRGDYESQKSRELFEREAKILHQIDRSQIPKFFAFFEEDQQLFLAQEYIKGQTYATLLRERQQYGDTFSEREIIKWLQDLLPILGYLHDRQIVHRDISLDNIMLQTDSNLPMLIDFGIGRSDLIQRQNQSEPAATMNNSAPPSIVGKVGYAPYEQIWLGQSFPSSDLYSLAVTAVVMLTGIDPQMLNSQASVKDQWRSKASVSTDLGQILDRMLEAAPANRYQSAAAVLADLEQFTRATLKCPITKVSAPPTVVHNAIKQQPTMIDHCLLESNSLNSNVSIKSDLTATFIIKCAKELTNCIGPIATMLVNKTLTKYPKLTPAELIELLAQKIPQPLAANEFSQRCRS
ncbi:MAG: serine/threonine protein kinase [Chamaesiphon sp.]|nr:serine/threonine protein kinase [Chamaesiphon sp.]